MKKSLFYAFALTIVAFLSSSQAKADLFTLDLNTFTAGDWKVARIIGYDDPGYVNPGRGGSTANPVYVIDSSTTQWKDLSVDWNTLTWSKAEDGARGTWEPKDELGNVLVPRDDWIAMTSENESRVENGFFAFKYTLEAVLEDGELADSVSGALSLLFSTDDYLAAVYANGTELYSQGIVNGAPVGNDQNGAGSWLSTSPLDFSVDLTDDGQLELIFVVHNTNAAGSNSNNAMGLYLNGTITTDIEMIPPREDGDVLTPEPATLLIFGLAGVVGLPFARRLRKRG